MKIKIGVIDDHEIFLESLVTLLGCNPNFQVVLKALSCKELQKKMAKNQIEVDIMLVDVNMPIIDGFKTVEWLKEYFPKIKPVALSMNDDDITVIRMLRAGCCGFLSKDIGPVELEKAIYAVYDHGYYEKDVSNLNHRSIRESEREYDALKLTEQELIFLKHACSDLTYKEIAQKMGVTERNVDVYREHLFAKLKVHNRATLCLQAVKKGFVNY